MHSGVNIWYGWECLYVFIFIVIVEAATTRATRKSRRVKPKGSLPPPKIPNALEMLTPGVTQVFIFLTHKFKADFLSWSTHYLYSDNYLLLVVKN